MHGYGPLNNPIDYVQDPKTVQILVVEDSKVQSAFMAHILHARNYQVFQTGDGIEALEFLEKQLPTMVISDVTMPRMDGYELSRRIRQDDRFREIPILLVTTLGSPMDILNGLKCGANHFILKPYDEQYLLARVDHILFNRHASKEGGCSMAFEVFLDGRKHSITAERMQIVDLLFSSMEKMLHQNTELERLNHQLTEANKELRESLLMVKTLRGLVPICAHCKKIRDGRGQWHKLEDYIHTHTEADFTHGICPCCEKSFFDPGSRSR